MLVTASGILSIGMQTPGHAALADVMGAIALAAWLLLLAMAC